MEISLECVVFYGDNFFANIEIPDDIKFYEYCRHNDKQRFYVTIYKNDDNLYEHLNKATAFRAHRYIFGDYMVLSLSQCHPINEDIPLMSLDELNDLFDKHLQGFYIKSERPSREQTLEQNKDNTFEIYKYGEKMVISEDMLQNFYKIYNPVNYVEYIAKPLGFTDKVGENVCMVISIVYMYSGYNDDRNNHLHRYDVDIIELSLLKEDFMHGHKITVSNSPEIEQEYKNALNTLLSLDNYRHEDFRNMRFTV